MLEKTFSTFHASSLLLQQQNREKGFKKYSDLISCLLVAEQNNELLIKNHESRPTGSTTFPEVNAISSDHSHGRNPRYGQGRGRGRGRGQEIRRGFKPYNNKIDKEDKRGKGEGGTSTNKYQKESICYQCGMKGHWS